MEVFMKKQLLAVILLSSLVGSAYTITPGGCEDRTRPTSMMDDAIKYGKQAARHLAKSWKALLAKLNHNGCSENFDQKGGIITDELGNISTALNPTEDSAGVAGKSLVAGGCGTDFNHDAVTVAMGNKIVCPVTAGDQAEFDILPGGKPVAPVTEKVKEFFVGLGNSSLMQDIENALLEKPCAIGCGAVAGSVVAYFGVGQWSPKGTLGKLTKTMSQLAVIAAGAVAANKYASEVVVSGVVTDLIGKALYVPLLLLKK